jgi:site-specific DNA-methyltransferase (adenine-specific)
MSTYQILQGDCLASLKMLPSESVNCCVTSPPYFGLRDYGCDGQIGHEETPEAFVGKLVEIFREVKRVLKDDGTCWVNIGDSYFNKQNNNRNNLSGSLGGNSVRAGGEYKTQKRSPGETNCKEKDLIGIPWMLAFALRADGWYLRQDIIWHKPNPMPESVTDRCTKAHEYIFLLSKSKQYYFDHIAMQEEATSKNKPRQFGATKQDGTLRNDVGRVFEDNGKRNKRSVWSVNVKPYKEAHFATYPPELILPCILAGCPEGGTVIDPFGGSGTTAQVAIENRRNAILCELNPDYIGIIKKRLSVLDVNLSI